MAPVAKLVGIFLQCFHGYSDSSHQSLINYTEPSSTTAKYCAQHEAPVVKNTPNNAFNLASLFPAFGTDNVLLTIEEISSTPLQLNFGFTSGGTRLPLTALVARLKTGALPTIYIDNPSLTTDATIRISVVGN